MTEYANENESETNKRQLQSDAECSAMAMTENSTKWQSVHFESKIDVSLYE